MMRQRSNLAAECEILARYRPIAPKPAGAPNISIAAASASASASAPAFPDSKRGSKRSRSSSSSAATAAFKKLRSSAAAISSSSRRPLIPAFHRLSSSSTSSSTSSSSCITDASDTRSELKTLALLPDALSSSESSLTSSHTATRQGEDPLDSLTELSLGSKGSKGSDGTTTNGAPQSWSKLDALLLNRCTQPMAITDVRSGGVLWSNRAFAAARNGELRHPVPLLSLGLGSDSSRVAQLWIFVAIKDALSPSKPQPVRASIASTILDSLRHESPATDRGLL